MYVQHFRISRVLFAPFLLHIFTFSQLMGRNNTELERDAVAKY